MPAALIDLHRQAEAELQPYGNAEIVATFGEPQAEYAAIRKSAALMDLQHRGVLEVTGRDRLPFLNNLLTNQTYDKNAKTGMAVGSGVYAFLLNAKSGRIIADMNVLESGDMTLLETDARLVPLVAESLEKYRFGEQVTFVQTDRWHELALHGPASAALLGELSGAPLPDLQALSSVSINLFGESVLVWRDDSTGSPGFHLIVPAGSVSSVWSKLMELAQMGEQAGDHAKRRLRPIGWAAFNAARIEAGRPIFGIDFDDSMLPAESGQMSRAVSVTKGCYPGQEIVARMYARQQVARQVAGLKFSDDALPIAGAPVTDDNGNAIGGITSSTISPMLSNTAIALALLKRPFFSVGTVVNAPAEGAVRKAVVCEVPFLKSPQRTKENNG